MANTLIPVAERNLTPRQVELLDRRRRRGHAYLVICFLCLIVGSLVTIWAGQDATYTPGWFRPMLYWDILLFVLAIIFGILGVTLRRGAYEYMSY